MRYTRRRLLGASAALASLTGCADSGSEATESVRATRTTAPPTDTATNSPIETEPETESPTETSESTTVRFWPRALTGVFEGEVSSETIEAAVEREFEEFWTYQAEWGQEPVTYLVSPSTLAIHEMRESFKAADELTVKYVYRGLGKNGRAEFQSTIRNQAAEQSDVDPETVSESAITVNGQQYLKYSAPTDASALVPTLPEMEFQRVDDEGDPIVSSDGFAVEEGFNIIEQFEGETDFFFSLTAEGAKSLRDAVEAASTEQVSDELFRLVARGNEFGTFGLSEKFQTAIENGNWDREMHLGFDRRYDGEDTVERLTGLPPVPFYCVVNP